MMNYCNPPRRLRMDEDDPWTDLHLLDQFWADFLESHTLATNDRQAHDHPHVTDSYEVNQEDRRLISSEANSLGKRSSDECSRDYSLPSKKSRRRAAVSAPTPPVRRSEQIRVLQERSQYE